MSIIVIVIMMLIQTACRFPHPTYTAQFQSFSSNKNCGHPKRAVVLNLRYAYPRGYAKTSYGARKSQYILFRYKL
jgi:hypothetical protein